jgi:hypothetical protein
MLEDDVEDDAQPDRMRGSDQVDQIASVAQTRIDVQKILNTVAVVGIQVAALLEDWAQP